MMCHSMSLSETLCLDDAAWSDGWRVQQLIRFCAIRNVHFVASTQIFIWPLRMIFRLVFKDVMAQSVLRHGIDLEHPPYFKLNQFSCNNIFRLCNILTISCVQAMCTSSRKSVKGYFLAGKNMVWWPVGASIFASNIGAGHFIGLAGSGAVSGIAVVGFEWIATYIILFLGWVFIPIYASADVATVPEYLHKRYGGQRLRVATSVVAMILYVLARIAVDIYAGALFIQMTLGINLYLAIASLLTVTALYTIFGGLKAVIYTDTMQTVIMIIGGIIVMVLGFDRIGGYGELENKYMKAIPATAAQAIASGNETVCGLPRPDALHMLRHPVDSDIPGPGIFVAMFFMGSWYWCTDQIIVQRTLAANTIQDAKGGCVMAALLKITPMYIMVMTGMISRILFPDEVACAVSEKCEEVCGNPVGCSNIAYPKLVIEILPAGLRGLMIAAMLSALMSTLTSVFNSTSAIFTLDIWKRIRRHASEKEQLIVGKVTVVVLIVISILWIPVLTVSSGGQIFIYLNVVLAAIGPPVFALYLLGILWTRPNETGAFWGLVFGFCSGMIRLVLEFIFPEPGCGDDETRPAIIGRVSYLYVSAITFGVSAIVLVIVSLLTSPPEKRYLYGTTWKTIRLRPEEKEISLQIKEGSSRAERCEGEGNEFLSNEKRYDVEDPMAEVAEKQDYHLSNIYEDPKWARVLNASAIFVMVIMAFLIGLYA